MIRSARNEDVGQIRDIYNHYIENTVITFEELPVSPEDMRNRFNEVTGLYPWLVYDDGGKVIGYAYAAGWKSRSAYRFSVESTVYVREDSLGKGIGAALYRELLDRLKAAGVHAVLAGISLPNEKSRKLHEKFGFVKVAHLPQVGYKFDQWIDVGYWELIFDRPSA